MESTVITEASLSFVGSKLCATGHTAIRHLFEVFAEERRGEGALLILKLEDGRSIELHDVHVKRYYVIITP